MLPMGARAEVAQGRYLQDIALDQVQGALPLAKDQSTVRCRCPLGARHADVALVQQVSSPARWTSVHEPVPPRHSVVADGIATHRKARSLGAYASARSCCRRAAAVVGADRARAVSSPSPPSSPSASAMLLSTCQIWAGTVPRTMTAS
jgi:hypothetical protein